LTYHNKDTLPTRSSSSSWQTGLPRVNLATYEALRLGR